MSPCSDSLSLRIPYPVKLASKRKSLTHYTKGTQSPSHPGSHCLYACDFRICFTPLPGFFSPFPHGTGSLSVDYEYLALEDGPPIFRQDFSCPALLVVRLVSPFEFRVRGYHPLWRPFPRTSTIRSTITYKAHPISLATTLGISVDFFSCSYLDVSVRRVRFACLCIQHAMT